MVEEICWPDGFSCDAQLNSPCWRTLVGTSWWISPLTTTKWVLSRVCCLCTAIWSYISSRWHQQIFYCNLTCVLITFIKILATVFIGTLPANSNRGTIKDFTGNTFFSLNCKCQVTSWTLKQPVTEKMRVKLWNCELVRNCERQTLKLRVTS